MDAILATINDFSTVAIDGKLPWFDYPELKRRDMQFFKDKTKGRDIVVGRKTWEIDLKCTPLKNRGTHYVVTSGNVDGDCIQVKPDISEIMERCAGAVCIGGAHLYSMLLPHCNNIFWTYYTIPNVMLKYFAKEVIQIKEPLNEIFERCNFHYSTLEPCSVKIVDDAMCNFYTFTKI